MFLLNFAQSTHISGCLQIILITSSINDLIHDRNVDLYIKCLIFMPELLDS